MKSRATDDLLSWRWEILPLSILSALLFYLMLTWNPLIILVLVLPVILIAYIYGASQLWWVAIGLVPFSVNTELFIESPIGMYLPTEPILFGFLVLSMLYFITHPVEKRYLNHPVSLMVMFYFGWMLITVISSSDRLVSLKSFIAQMWYVVPVLYLGSKMLKKKENRFRFLNVYFAGFSVVALYTLIRLWGHGFPQKESQWLMQPFLKDHTIMGAVLGLVLPYMYLRCFSRSIRPENRILWIGIAIVSTVVLIFTYSRAAWLSLAVAGVFYVFILMRVRFRYLIGVGVVMMGILLWNQDALIDKLSGNRSESSGEVVENIESISNISTDASNLERINRWNVAIEMWKDRPLFGWGPGTYQFMYAPFQKSADLTIISTNIGDVGNAHSEYLGTLAESGLPAFVLFLIMLVVIFGTAYNRILLLQGDDRMILLGVLLGLIAYFTHGVLNNFLNSDKVSVLIWGFTAIILHYDIDFKLGKLEPKSLAQDIRSFEKDP